MTEKEEPDSHNKKEHEEHKKDHKEVKHESHKKVIEHKSHRKKISKTKILLLGFGLIIGLIAGYIIAEGTSMSVFSTGCNDKLGEKAQNFVIDNFLASQGLGAKAGDVVKEGSLCKINIEITKNGNKLQDSQVYMTPDGKYLILGQVIPTSKNIAQQQDNQQDQQEPKATCEDLKKEDTPELDAFVVSYCPFGLQMQRVLTKLVEEVPELKDYIHIKYIGSISDGKITSMHGDKEAQENLRQICIREEQPDKYWEYLTCFIKDDNYTACLDSTGVDTTKLNECMNDSSKGLAYAQEDFDLQKKYSVSGSPTLILNGNRVSEFDFGGRSANAVETLLCCGFNNEPDACNTNATEEQAATSFSETYAKGGSSSGGSC